MVKETDKAIEQLISAQRACEELYMQMADELEGGKLLLFPVHEESEP